MSRKQGFSTDPTYAGRDAIVGEADALTCCQIIQKGRDDRLSTSTAYCIVSPIIRINDHDK